MRSSPLLVPGFIGDDVFKLHPEADVAEGLGLLDARLWLAMVSRSASTEARRMSRGSSTCGLDGARRRDAAEHGDLVGQGLAMSQLVRISFWKRAQAVAERAGRAVPSTAGNHHGLILAGQVVVELLNELVGAGRCRGECRLVRGLWMSLFFCVRTAMAAFLSLAKFAKPLTPARRGVNDYKNKGEGSSPSPSLVRQQSHLERSEKRGQAPLCAGALWAVPATVPDPFSERS